MAIFNFQILKRVQVGNPLCGYEMGFISLRMKKKKTEAWDNSDMVY